MNKIYTFILMAFLAVGFIACEDDDCDRLHIDMDMMGIPTVLKGSFPVGTLTPAVGDSIVFVPQLLDTVGVSYAWKLNGQEVSSDSAFTYRIEKPCRAKVECTLKNAKGEVMLEADIVSKTDLTQGVLIVQKNSVDYYDTETGKRYSDVYSSLNYGEGINLGSYDDLYATRIDDKLYMMVSTSTSNVEHIFSADAKTLYAENSAVVAANLDGFVPLNDQQALVVGGGAYRMDLTSFSKVQLLKKYGWAIYNGIVVNGKLLGNMTYQSLAKVNVYGLNDVLNAAEKLQLEENAGLYKDEWAHIEMALRKRQARIKQEIERGVDTYWLSKPLRTGVGHKHNLRLEGGGNDGFRYSASVQYNDILGVMKGSDRKTFNGNINLMYQQEKLLFRNNLEVGLSESNESPYGSFDQYVKLNPYWRERGEDGKVLKELEQKGDFWTTAPENPLYNATLDLVDKKTYTTITNNFDVEWKPWESLTLRSRIGLSKQVNDYDNFKPADHTKFKDYSDEQIFRKGEYIYSSGKSFSYDWSLTLSYSRNFKEKHELYVGLDYNVAQEKSHSYTFQVEGFPQSNIKFLSMALQYQKDGKPTGSESLNRRIGVTGNVNYIYDNRYFADVAYRMDGASQFGSSKRFAPFYSFGIGWNIHKEKFMENVLWLDRLKLRGSYAVTGSVNFDAYQALATYEYYTDDRYRYWFGSHLQGLANEDLEWQKTDKWNFGLEVGAFHNRLKVTADVYTNQTNNLLSEMYLPLTNGFPSYTDNVGKVKNKGVEVALSGYPIRNTEKNIIWSVSASFIHEKNEIVKISEALKVANEELELQGGSNPNFMYREGEALRTIYVVPSLGIDPSTGQELFVDRFGNITFVWDARDKVACGVTDPKFRGNINTMFTFRDLSVNLSFGYRLGGSQYNSTLVDRVENANTRYNVDRRVYKDRWINPGDHTFFKDVRNTQTTQMSSRFVQKENTLECQSIQVKYDFLQPWVKKHLGTQYLSLSFNTDNLFRVSSIKQERGIAYPFSRRFTFSLSATF